MSSTSKISVIIATFNAAEHLEKCIISTIEQNYSDTEILIVDGNSTDETVDIIEAFGNQIDWWVSEPDKGIYDAWNKAIARATGDWLLFRGADDFFYSSESLSKVAAQLVKLPEGITMAYGSMIQFDEDSRCLGYVGSPWECVCNDIRTRMPIPHPSTFHRRSAFEKYGLFDASYRIAGDYDFVFRLYKRDPNQFAFLPDTVVTAYRHIGCSTTQYKTVYL